MVGLVSEIQDLQKFPLFDIFEPTSGKPSPVLAQFTLVSFFLRVSATGETRLPGGNTQT